MKIGEPFNPYRRFVGVFVPLGLLRCREISDGAKLTWGRLGLYAGKDGECFVTRAELAEDMGLHVATVGRHLEELVAFKLLRRVRRGRGLSALCQFLWHPILETCERAISDSARVRAHGEGADNAFLRHQKPPDGADKRDLSEIQIAQECTPDSAKVRGGIKEEKIPLKDSLTPARHTMERRTPLALVSQQLSDWPRGGWETSEDFEAWWLRLVQTHPNKSRNRTAKTKALGLIRANELNRAEFDEGYRNARTAAGERWIEQRGRFAPNLWQLLDDMAWKFSAPAIPPASEYERAEDYLRRIDSE